MHFLGFTIIFLMNQIQNFELNFVSSVVTNLLKGHFLVMLYTNLFGCILVLVDKIFIRVKVVSQYIINNIFQLFIKEILVIFEGCTHIKNTLFVFIGLLQLW